VRKILKPLLLLVMLTACTAQTVHKDIEDGWKNMDTILERIQAPVFPDKIFDITDLGYSSHNYMHKHFSHRPMFHFP